jgi:hypothetical protein
MAKKSNKALDKVIDYRNVFSTSEGKRVLYDLMKVCHFMHSSFTGDSTEIIFREGERNVVNYILTMLKQDPELILEEIRLRENEELDYV